jgi:hypothetical protein
MIRPLARCGPERAASVAFICVVGRCGPLPADAGMPDLVRVIAARNIPGGTQARGEQIDGLARNTAVPAAGFDDGFDGEIVVL